MGGTNDVCLFIACVFMGETAAWEGLNLLSRKKVEAFLGCRLLLGIEVDGGNRKSEGML
ncbi:hypothetical protein IC582_029428 [Cucumis melo]